MICAPKVLGLSVAQQNKLKQRAQTLKGAMTQKATSPQVADMTSRA